MKVRGELKEAYTEPEGIFENLVLCFSVHEIIGHTVEDITNKTAPVSEAGETSTVSILLEEGEYKSSTNLDVDNSNDDSYRSKKSHLPS